MFPSPPLLEASCRVLASTCSCPCHEMPGSWRVLHDNIQQSPAVEVAELHWLTCCSDAPGSVGLLQSVEPDADRADATLVMMGLGLALEAQVHVSQSVQNPFC